MILVQLDSVTDIIDYFHIVFVTAKTHVSLVTTQGQRYMIHADAEALTCITQAVWLTGGSDLRLDQPSTPPLQVRLLQHMNGGKWRVLGGGSIFDLPYLLQELALPDAGWYYVEGESPYQEDSYQIPPVIHGREN